MTILECFEAWNDNQIKSKLHGQTVNVSFRNGASMRGVETNFMKTAVYDDKNRTITGIIINGEKEFAIPSYEVVQFSILSE
ncbi:MAG: hypothetical protein NC453_26360 [Muribaculum sp.]|nr:hypothetical protein [Muribaculum sp.]